MSRVQTFVNFVRLLLCLGILLGYNASAAKFPPGGEKIIVQERHESGQKIKYNARLNNHYLRYVIQRDGHKEVIRLGQVKKALKLMNAPYVFSPNGEYARKGIPLTLFIDKTETPPKVKIVVRYLTGEDNGVVTIGLDDLSLSQQNRELEKRPSSQGLPTSMEVDLVRGPSHDEKAVKAQLLLKPISHISEFAEVRIYSRSHLTPGIARYNKGVGISWSVFIESYSMAHTGNALIVEEPFSVGGKNLFEAVPTGGLKIHLKPDHSSTVYIYGEIERFKKSEPWPFHPEHIRGLVIKGKDGKNKQCLYKDFIKPPEE